MGRNTLTRTLIEIVSADAEGGHIMVRIPEWDPDQLVRVRLAEVPPHVRPWYVVGHSVHAEVTLEVRTIRELRIAKWEAN